MHSRFLALAALSVCNATSSTPESSREGAKAAASSLAPLQLDRPLEVQRRAPAPGEPIALRGREKLLCAVRHDAPTACVGELALAVDAVDRAKDDGRYTRSHAEKPIAIDGVDLRSLSVEGYTRCVHTEGGSAECWRQDLGRHKGQFPSPAPFGSVRSVSASDHLCVIRGNGQLRCNGGRPCRGPDDDYDLAEVIAVPGIDTALAVSTTSNLSCAILKDHSVSCWGNVRKSDCAFEATPIPDLANVVSVAADDYFACAIRADNHVFCWGYNGTEYLLGASRPGHSRSPVEVPMASPAVKLSLSVGGAAVLKADGSVVAWGQGALSGDDRSPRKLPFAQPAVDIVTLSGMVCALLVDGAIQCEGRDVEDAAKDGTPRPPFEGLEPWVNAPLYRLAPRPSTP